MSRNDGPWWSWFGRWLAGVDAAETEVEAAISHFEAATGEQAVRSMSRALARDEEQAVVRICYGSTKPPRRA
jgi:hypothetical protein